MTESKIIGRVLFRMRCNKCGRVGAWLSDLNEADKNDAKHDSAMHGEKASA